MANHDLHTLLQRLGTIVDAEVTALAAQHEANDATVPDPRPQIGTHLLQLGCTMVDRGGVDVDLLKAAVVDVQRRCSMLTRDDPLGEVPIEGYALLHCEYGSPSTRPCRG